MSSILSSSIYNCVWDDYFATTDVILTSFLIRVGNIYCTCHKNVRPNDERSNNRNYMTINHIESDYITLNYLVWPLSPNITCTSRVAAADKYLYLDKYPGLLSQHPVNTHWTLGPSSSWHIPRPNVSDEIWIPWSQCSQLWKPIISHRARALLCYVTGCVNRIIRK